MRWDVSALVLMPDYVHLLVYLPEAVNCTGSTGYGAGGLLRG